MLFVSSVGLFIVIKTVLKLYVPSNIQGHVIIFNTVTIPMNHIEDHNGQKLLKEIVTQKENKYYPIKTYCYCPITDSLSEILGRNGFLEKCELWRTRDISNGILTYVYDGAVWKSFLTTREDHFFQSHII